MNEEERYLFDVQGYLLLRGVLGGAEVAALNALIDQQDLPAPGETLNEQRFGGFDLLAANDGIDQRSVGGFLLWGQPFRDLMDHPRILPYLKDLVDPGVRLDRYYGIYMRRGTFGLHLHGGATPYDRSEFYHYHDGEMFNGITVVSWALTDLPPEQGGFLCIPGSHKANYALPETFDWSRHNPGCIVQVPMRAGDALIFTGALTHGTMPWLAPHHRRTLIFKYAPGHSAYGSGYLRWPSELKELLTPDQLRLLEPPYTYEREEVGGGQAAVALPAWARGRARSTAPTGA